MLDRALISRIGNPGGKKLNEAGVPIFFPDIIIYTSVYKNIFINEQKRFVSHHNVCLGNSKSLLV